MRERSARLMARAFGLTLAASSLVAAGACTFLLDSERVQCRNNVDCAGRGIAQAVCSEGVCITNATSSVDSGQDAAPVDPQWGCIGNMPADPPEDRAAKVDMGFRFLDGLGTAPLPGAKVDACEKDDVTCANPIGSGISNAEGAVSIPVFTGFKGSFKIDEDAGAGNRELDPQYLSALPTPGITRDAGFGYASYIGVWPVFRKGDFKTIAAVSGGGLPEDGAAHVLFIAVKCDGTRGAGLTVSPDTRGPKTYGFYTDSNNTPSLTLPATESEGAGGYINLTPGEITFTVRRVEGGPLVGVHKIRLRPDTLTLVTFAPNKTNQ